MTVITKGSDMQKKPEPLDRPVIVGAMRYNVGHKVPRNRYSIGRHYVIICGIKCNTVLIFLTFLTMILTLTAAISGLLYYNELNATRPTRFRGYCTIPMEVAKAASQVQTEEAASYRVPLRWSPEPEVTLITNVDNQTPGEMLTSLLERFDIDDNVEKISVVNGGQNVEFIHDFKANASGIVDSQRCFVMDLDPEAVLSPGVFLMHIESGEDFDVMRVHRRLRAMLPAAAASLQQLSTVLAERCVDRPTYQLEKEDGNTIRKRAVEEPKQQYMHFAGKHILEISIDNMGELLEYEKRHA